MRQEVIDDVKWQKDATEELSDNKQEKVMTENSSYSK